MTRKLTNNRMQMKPNDFEKNMAQKKHNGKSYCINKMAKELEGLEDGPKAEMHTD